MAYSINSPNAQDDYAIDQYRLNRLGGANLDYQLAQIANEHPDWTPTQVRMAQQGGLGGAPSMRLLSGAGLPARFRITGQDFDPGQQPAGAVNYAGNPRQLVDWRAKQENAFRLGQIKSDQAQLDKLDPKDDDDADKIAELKGRIGALTDEAQSSASAPEPQPAVPLGEGTAGQEAPVYKAGGPGTSVNLSNGGSVYFGPAAGAPPFRIGGSAVASAQPSSAAPAGNPGNYFPGTPQPFSILGPMAPIPDESSDAAPAAQPAPLHLSKKQINRAITARNNLKAVTDAGLPQPYIDAANGNVASVDESNTNAPAPFTAGPAAAPQPFSLGGSDATADANPDFTPAQKALQAKGFLKGATPTAPKITNQDDYEALPAGSQYLDPTGQLRTKSK